MQSDEEPTIYGPDDIADIDYGSDLSVPGDYPFTRGRLRTAHQRHRNWIYRELSGEGSPKRANEQLRHLLASGATGLDVIGDAPTVALLDPDHPYAEHTVG